MVQFSERLLREIWSSDLCHVTCVPVPYAQETVLIARELDIPEVLKRALYELARSKDPRDKLSLDDLRRVRAAHGELQIAWAGFVWSVPNAHAFHCAGRPDSKAPYGGCMAAAGHDRFQTWRDVLEEEELFSPSDPLYALQRLAEIDWSCRGYCPSCVQARREAFTRKREEWWSKLDQWLEL